MEWIIENMTDATVAASVAMLQASILGYYRLQIWCHNVPHGLLQLIQTAVVGQPSQLQSDYVSYTLTTSGYMILNTSY